jgi:hypothetical protein
MARQPLGRKKRNRIASKLGLPVGAAFVDSVWGRNWVEAFVSKDTSFLVNARTGDFTQLLDQGKEVTTNPQWRKIGCCA